MEVICLEESSFYELIYKVVAATKDDQKTQNENSISGDDAMKKLNIIKQNDVAETARFRPRLDSANHRESPITL